MDYITNSSVNTYNWLSENLRARNVTDDAGYQRQYKTYWNMNKFISNPEWYAAYFRFLEQNKNNNQANLCQLCNELYRIPVHENRQCLHFSFATKLIHMINRTMPIYDSRIKNFYFLPETGNNFEQKLNCRLNSYDFLKREYQRIIENCLLDRSINSFRERFDNNIITDERVIDCLIWSFVGIANKGGFRNNDFIYQ